MPLVIEVAAALIQDDAGRYLITQRRRGSHLAGLWEFPGGKQEAGESPQACLRRELVEELAGNFSVGEKFDTISWDYPDRTVILHFFRCRLESGTMHTTIERCDGVELARSVLEAARHYAAPSIELELHAPTEAPLIAADPDKARQVLTNLVDNAVKYSPDGGKVSLEITPDGPVLRFAVSDEGLGVPPAEQRRIFEKFYRLDPDLTRGVGGTGLGLYISRELLERMGGRIWVESSGSNGSRFVAELPVAV